MAERQQHRDGRTTDTRQLILKEAEKLYYAGGYDHISLQVIADSLDISKAALFHHFKNKRELFYEMVMMIIAHMREMFEDIVNEERLSTREKLYLCMQRLAQGPTFDIMHFLREDYPRLEPEQQHKGSEEWEMFTRDMIQRIFKEGIERGELREHNLMLSTNLFLNSSILLPHVDSPVGVRMDEASREKYMQTLLDMLLEGLNKK